MSVLNDFFKKKDAPKETESIETENGDIRIITLTEDDKGTFRQKLDELKTDPNDIELAYRKFQDEFVKITEEELDKEYSSNIVYTEPKVLVKRFMCPKCGKEIISKAPVIYNPFNLEKIARHECECGFKCNLDFAYPRLMVLDSDGKEIEAYPR